MHILRKKNKFHTLLGIVLLFFILVFLIYLQSGNLLKNTYADLKQKIMMIDHGFSTPRNILLGEASAKELPFVFPKNIYRSITQKVSGFPERPNLEKIEITIKFKEYRKILDDRKRSLKAGMLSDPGSLWLIVCSLRVITNFFRILLNNFLCLDYKNQFQDQKCKQIS